MAAKTRSAYEKPAVLRPGAGRFAPVCCKRDMVLQAT